MSDFGDFVDIVYATRDRALLEDFLQGITTPSEREAFVQRLEIVRRLLSGQAQAKIAKDLGVGVATVTRGSKELSQGHFKVLKKS